MKILYVDDERSAHTNFHYATKERIDISEINYFYDYESAVEYAKHHEIDCAFLDVTLPGKNGIELAKVLMNLQPRIEIAFVTGHDEYAREAYKVKGRAYISKPYSADEIDEVLTLMNKLVQQPEKVENESYDDSIRIYAKTFGMFDFMVNGYPVHFKNAKAKELLAFLVHQMGGTTTNAQIFFALWERQEYTQATSTYVRRTVRALKRELDNLGVSEILTTERNSVSLDYQKINCDYYEVINGNASAGCLYNGEYMKQYAWAEETIPLLDRIVEKMKK